MKLISHLKNGTILHLERSGSLTISVAENTHYRWLSFGDVIQSIMHKRKLASLTLPHQILLCLPLLWMHSPKVIEFGLGGGNFTRFMSARYGVNTVTSIEYDERVISLFHQYFNPLLAITDIKAEEANHYIGSNSLAQFDWIIIDIYPSKGVLEKILKKMYKMPSSLKALSINLPNYSDNEIEQLLKRLSPFKDKFEVRYFNVPKYSNIIIHITTKENLINAPFNPNFPPFQNTRWLSYWQQGNIL